MPFLYQLSNYINPTGHPVSSAYLGYWGASLGTFAFGLLIKSSHLPERATRSAWNDLFFASHQLWHLCINVGFVLGTFLAWDEFLKVAPLCGTD